MHVITRPLEKALLFRAQCLKAGIKSEILPCLEHVAYQTELKPIQDYDGLIISSGYVARAIKHYLLRPMHCPVFVTGEATAQTCLSMNSELNIIQTIGDSISSLTSVLSKDQRYLYPCAKDISLAAQDLITAYQIDVLPVYEMRMRTVLSAQDIQLLASPDLKKISFFSYRTAQAFTNLVDCDITKEIQAVCLSKNVANALNPECWGDIRLSVQANAMDMIDALT